jgi:hypothetical protein
MAQMELSIPKAPDVSLALEATNNRLQALVGELLKENQELRFRLHMLERKAQSVTETAEEPLKLQEPPLPLAQRD